MMKEESGYTSLKLSFDPTLDSVSVWLQSLSETNTHESSRHIYEALCRIELQSVPADIQFTILEKFRPVVFFHSRNLKELVLAAPTPLDKRSRKIAKLSTQLHRELASGYQRLTQQREFFANFLATQQAQVIHRAMQSTSMAMLRNAQLYAPPPTTLWSYTHSLYRLAEKLGLKTTPVQEPLSPFNRKPSISDIVKRSALFSLTNPYAFSPADMEAVFFLLEKLSPLAFLENEAAHDGMNADFCLDIHRGQPPTHISHTRKLATERYLFTKKLVDDLNQRIKNGCRCDDPVNNLGVEKLGKLVQYLGAAEDNPRMATVPQQVVSGFEALLSVLTMERQKNKITDPALLGKDWHVSSTLELQPLEHESQAPHITFGPVSKNKSSPPLFTPCKTAASRIEGYCIVETKSEGIGSGQLVALKNDVSLKLGVVRWMQDLPHIGTRRLGVEILHGNLFPAKLEKKPGTSAKAILIFDAGGTETENTFNIIVQPGKYRSEARLICDDARCRDMTLGRILEANPFFFRYAVIPEQTPSESDSKQIQR